MKDYQFLQQKYILNTYPNRGITLVKGKGMYLYDESGKKYLDMMSNYGVSIFGYNHPKINNAINVQLKKLINLHGSFNSDVRSIAAKELIERCGNNFSQLYFSNSGAEAIEAALKFIALTTGKSSKGGSPFGRKKIIACEHSYHGKTLGALSLTYGDKYRKPFEPFSWQVEFVKYDDITSLEKTIDSNTAAFILEPVQGEGGLLTPQKGYLQKVKNLCKKHGILLVFDEIQSGTGRTGRFLASQWEEVSSDILCLGKGLAGGLPIGATLVTKEIAEKIPRNIHTSTFGGNPLTCAGIITTLKLLDQKRLSYIQSTGTYFWKKLQTIKSDFVGEIRGKGLMIGLEIKSNKRNDVLRLLQQNGVLVIPAGETVVRFLAPYIVEKKHIDMVIKVLKEILYVSLSTGKIE